MAGLFYASRNVRRNDWKNYIDALNIHLYPGALGYGFIRYVPRRHLLQFLSNTKMDGAPDFVLKTKENHPDLFIIEYIEPYEINNLARGLDIGSEKKRREAAIDSVNRNQIMLTRQITLLQDKQGIAGFLLLQPVYLKNASIVTVEERWNSLIGWTYSPIRIDDLLTGISEEMGNVAEFLVFEEVSDRTSAILFDSGKIFKNRKNESISEIDYKTYSFTKEIKIQNSGRTWKIRTVSTPDFEKGSNTGMPIFVLGAGLLISLLVAGILASIAQTKERAQALAEQMTIKLQRSEEEARIAFRNLSNQKYALDQHAIVAITDVGGKIIYANDKFCEISKYSRDELIGQNHRILKSGYHPTEFFEEMFKTISNGMVWKGEIKNCKKDGSFYWVATTIVPFRDVEGKIFEYISMRIDITELKEIEEKLRIANFTKDKFFNIIAHDLKNPFNGILGLTELFLSEVNDGVSKDQQIEYLTLIQSAAKSAFQLLENLLLWARAQSKQIEFIPKNISFNSIINDTLPLLSVNLLKKKLHIDQDLSEDDFVYADISLIGTVVRNLLTNAIKFTHPGGRILIKTSVIGDFLKVEIIDSGVGIESKNIEKLFHLEIKFQKAGTEKETGTGLGLLICKEFIEMHGGKIWAESKFGEGSNFIFTLPKGQ